MALIYMIYISIWHVIYINDHCYNINFEWNEGHNYLDNVFYNFIETSIIRNDLILILQMVPANLLKDLIS